MRFKYAHGHTRVEIHKCMHEYMHRKKKKKKKKIKRKIISAAIFFVYCSTWWGMNAW